MNLEESWENFKSNYYLKSDCNYVKIVKLLTILDSFGAYPLLKIPLSLKALISKRFNCTDVPSENYFTFPTILQRAVNLYISNIKYQNIRRPMKPQPPEKTVADYYKKIYINTSRRERRIIFNCLYFAIIPLLLYIFFNFWVIFYLIIILLPPTSLVYFFILKLDFFEDVSISGSVRLTQQEIKNKQNELDKEYLNKLHNFEKSVNEYEKELFTYRMNQGKISKKIEPHIDKILFEIQNNFHIPSKENIQFFENPKSGALESYFYKKLHIKFPLYVKKDIKIGPYYPDIALIIKNVCYIDIEIDEPYSFDEKCPIHYIGSSDNERDAFFIESGWYVVRFSEFQIKKYSADCLDFIDNLVNFFINNDLLHLRNISKIQEKIKAKKWSYEEAETMIQKDWRNTYL